MTLNSTSNDTLPLLWQFPDLNIGRKKRDTYYNEEENEIAHQSNTFPPSLTTVTSKLHDAFLLYTMAKSSPDCRTKIACAFGTAAAQNRNLNSNFAPASVGKYLKLISMAMRGFLGDSSDLSGLEMLEDLGDEFMMSAERRSLEHDEYCSQIECNKCFSI